MFISDYNHYPLTTPTIWQMVILRNVGLIKNSILAKVLSCSLNTLKIEIKRLGLSKIKYQKEYIEKSYITIIRNNWNILPNSQIISLLEMSQEQFEFELKENDFLNVKLGYKPDCEEVKYFPLNDLEIKKNKENQSNY